MEVDINEQIEILKDLTILDLNSLGIIHTLLNQMYKEEVRHRRLIRRKYKKVLIEMQQLRLFNNLDGKMVYLVEDPQKRFKYALRRFYLENRHRWLANLSGIEED